MVLAEGLEGMIGLHLGELTDITLNDLFGDSMIRAERAAASFLVLAVESADLVDGDRIILVGVRPFKAEPLTNARHRYGVRL